MSIGAAIAGLTVMAATGGLGVDIFDRSSMLWGAALLVGAPLATVVLGESILRLERKRHPLVDTLRVLRSLVLPFLAVFLFLTAIVGMPLDHWAVRVSLTLLCISILHASLSLIDDVIFQGAEAGSWQERVPRLALDLARLLVVLFGGAIIYSSVWQKDLGSLITALGVGSIVIGLALQEPLGNVFAGVMLLFERPFAPGDFIKVGDDEGKVVEVNWRAVHLRTRTNDLIVVPNATLAKETFRNNTRPSPVHVEWITLGYSYDDPPNKVKRVLLDAAYATRGVLEDPMPAVRTLEYGDFAITYRVHLPVEHYERLPSVRDEFMTRVWYASRRAGLTIPYPTQTEMSVTKEELDAVYGKDPEKLLPKFSILGLDRAPAELLRSMAKRAKVREYARGDRVVEEGQPLPGLYLVVSGEAAVLAKDSSGREQEMGRVRVGESFGESSVITGEPSEVSVLAIEDLDVLVLDDEAVQELIDREPQVARELGGLVDIRMRAVRALRRKAIATN